MKALYDETCMACSALITRNYSTSFSMGIRLFAPRFREPIAAIYGFVRFADEIVDTFHNHNKGELLERFKADTYRAIDEGISLNPVLHAFQQVVNDYGIEREHIEAFLWSMEMDLYHTRYKPELYEEYIYGSAEVVGLMCLRVFCEGDNDLYDRLKEPARALGSAFQKINFLRDMQADYEERGRIYFPGMDFTTFDDEHKAIVEDDIAKDFRYALEGIKQLPKGVRLGVYLAYVYYTKLFKRIREVNARIVKEKRIRVPDSSKVLLLCSTAVRDRMNWL